MGEQRRMFTELQGQISELGPDELQKPLEEIASGATCFGRLDEWVRWYHYLLGELIPRAHESYLEPLLEVLITGFIALHRDTSEAEPYDGFVDDALRTLGKCMMQPQCWQGKDIAHGNILQRHYRQGVGNWGWEDASGDFSASMFFCVKYLPVSSIAGWMRSVLAIESPHWRAQLICWLVGARGFLDGSIVWPSQLKSTARPSVDWSWSHCLKPRSEEPDIPAPPMLSRASREAVVEAVRSEISEDRYLEWLDSFFRTPPLFEELAEIPTEFERIYLR